MVDFEGVLGKYYFCSRIELEKLSRGILAISSNTLTSPNV